MINRFAASVRPAGWRNAVVAAAAATGLGVIGGLVSPPADTRSDFLAYAQTPPTPGPRALPDFPDIIERVKPAVVGIRVQIEDETVGGQVSPGRSRVEPPRGPTEGSDEPRRRLAMSQGSGFFISSDG